MTKKKKELNHAKSCLPAQVDMLVVDFGLSWKLKGTVSAVWHEIPKNYTTKLVRRLKS